MQTPPPLPYQRPPGWWDRNWKWFMPLVGVAGIFLMGGFVVAVFGFMKSSDAYVGALARAKAAPTVIDVLGTPIHEGFFVTGNVSANGTSGKAVLAIPVAGPKGKATIYVAASKALGEWRYDRLIVQVDQTGQSIDLSDRRDRSGR